MVFKIIFVGINGSASDFRDFEKCGSDWVISFRNIGASCCCPFYVLSCWRLHAKICSYSCMDIQGKMRY